MEKDYFVHDSVVYYWLFAMDPTCLEDNIPSCQCKLGHWCHADDNCGGDIYLGDNCHLLCRRCMKDAPLNMVGWTSPYSVPNISNNLISFDGLVGKKCLNPTSIIGQICDGPGLPYMVKLLKSAIEQYELNESI